MSLLILACLSLTPVLPGRGTVAEPLVSQSTVSRRPGTDLFEVLGKGRGADRSEARTQALADARKQAIESRQTRIETETVVIQTHEGSSARSFMRSSSEGSLRAGRVVFEEVVREEAPVEMIVRVEYSLAQLAPWTWLDEHWARYHSNDADREALGREFEAFLGDARLARDIDALILGYERALTHRGDTRFLIQLCSLLQDNGLSSLSSARLRAWSTREAWIAERSFERVQALAEGLLELGESGSARRLLRSWSDRERGVWTEAQQEAVGEWIDSITSAIDLHTVLWNPAAYSALERGQVESLRPFIERRWAVLAEEFAYKGCLEGALYNPEHGGVAAPSHWMLTYEHRSTGLLFHLLPGNPDFTFDDRLGGGAARIDPFLISAVECTVGAFRFRNAGPEEAHLPCFDLSLAEARGWCERAGLQLPTSAEWVYACKAGSPWDYVFGPRATDINGAANVLDLSYLRASERPGLASQAAGWDDGSPWISVAGGRIPNAFGLSDMQGNLWEWCEDGLLRGGCLYDSPSDCGWSAVHSPELPQEEPFGFRPVQRLQG